MIQVKLTNNTILNVSQYEVNDKGKSLTVRINGKRYIIDSSVIKGIEKIN